MRLWPSSKENSMKNRHKTLRPSSEVVLKGVGISPGLALGPSYVIDAGMPQFAEYEVPAAELDAELARFSEAVAKAQRQLKKLKAKASLLPPSAAEEVAFLLDAHLQMVTGSRLIRGVEARIRREYRNAEAAVCQEINQIIQEFQAINDPYMAARAKDIQESGQRLIRNLTQSAFHSFSHVPKGSVVVAEDFTPADTALMEPGHIVGFATSLGGAEGHTAIMARSLSLPAVAGMVGLIDSVRNGQMILIDGERGEIVIDPSPARLDDIKRRRSVLRRRHQQLSRLLAVPAVTEDGTHIRLEANLELPREAEIAMQHGADGVGLLRTEFLFMNRDQIPDEEEQYQILRTIMKKLGGKPMTIRTLDVGGDKLPASLSSSFPQSPVPQLGLRAIRFCLKAPAFFESQLAAILRVAAEGPVRILLPMVTSIEEIAAARKIIGQAARKLHRRGLPVKELPPLGVMIEVPGAALIADALAQHADFFAIGTNDLTMYTLAVNRDEELVAHLYDPLHPAVLRLIQFAAEAALRARIGLSLCGEMAADPRFTAFLIGLGIRDFSVSPPSLLPVKERVRKIDTAAATKLAQQIMTLTDREAIVSLLKNGT